MLVEIQSTYVDGCENVAIYELDEPNELTEDFWDDEVFPLSGDGHHRNVTSIETATIIEAANPTFLGQVREWQG